MRTTPEGRVLNLVEDNNCSHMTAVLFSCWGCGLIRHSVEVGDFDASQFVNKLEPSWSQVLSAVFDEHDRLSPKCNPNKHRFCVYSTVGIDLLERMPTV